MDRDLKNIRKQLLFDVEVRTGGFWALVNIPDLFYIWFEIDHFESSCNYTNNKNTSPFKDLQ